MFAVSASIVAEAVASRFSHLEPDGSSLLHSAGSASASPALTEISRLSAEVPYDGVATFMLKGDAAVSADSAGSSLGAFSRSRLLVLIKRFFEGRTRHL
ncbi:hypothetical protein B5F40_00420 [Gordonibacter sp. An230]|nr:hypothetical protein B5F40_00420 [Gordonibacter sp. An230]